VEVEGGEEEDRWKRDDDGQEEREFGLVSDRLCLLSAERVVGWLLVYVWSHQNS